MNKILLNIRSIPGVWAILAIDKKRALTYQVFPSSYDANTVKDIAIPVLNFGRSHERALVADFFFENGKGRMYSRQEAVVLILGRPDLNLDMLGNVCKEAIPAICRKFSRGDLADNMPVTSGNNRSPGFDFLLKAMNIIAANVQQKIGAYLVTKYMRATKDRLAETYKFLSSITIDNNGVAQLIKGCAPHKGDDLLKGFAHWANCFVASAARSSEKLSASDILELTIDIKDKLELTGFYQIYADIGI